jgi:predicted dehydrogenase
MPGVEVVFVLTKPPTTHCQVALKALAAGKHVVVEKPMAQTASECDEMIAAAKRAGKVLTVHQNRRWDKNFQACLNGIKEGKIGEPKFIEINLGGGVGPFDALCDWGVHLFDQILCLNPSPIVDVTACAVNPDGPVDRTGSAATLIRFEKPPQVLYTCLSGQPQEGIDRPRQALPRFYVVGDKGAFQVGPGEQFPFQRAFYEGLWSCLREDGPVPVTPVSARNAIHLIEIVYESIRTRKAVKGARRFE